MSDYSVGPSASHGWPFSDCTIHIQHRGKGLDLRLIEDTCSEFGRILKTYEWHSKKSGTPQIFVMFDSPEAVQNALNSAHDHSVRLWKSGYHLLNMCESTSERLKGYLKGDGLTADHPLFRRISLKRTSKPYHSKPWTGKQKNYHETPTGPRYEPYSLDNRPSTSTSARISQPSRSHVEFPPRREQMPPQSPTKTSGTWTKAASHSPSRRSPATPVPPMSSAAPTATATASPSPAPAAVPNNVVLDPELLNKKLEAEIKKLVSDYIDSISKVQSLESENEKLCTQLKSSREEADLLRDTVKRVEGREQAVIALLSKSENNQRAVKEANVKVVQAVKGLQVQCGALHAGKIRAEADREAMAKKIAALEAQLAGTQTQLAGTQTQLANARAQLVARPQSVNPVTAEASAQTELTRSVTEEASSVDPEEVCTTPNVVPEYMHNTNPGKANLEHLVGLSDAFKDIDDLVRTAFDSL